MTNRVDSGAFCEICKRCKARLPHNQWCQQCESASFKEASKSWSSGSHDLDKFIKKTQLKAIDHVDYLEWIPYERITDITFIAYGAYGSVSCGTWLDGPRWNWSDNSKSWERTDFIKGSGDSRKQIDEAEKTRLDLMSEQFIITSPPKSHNAYYTTREIKVIHVSPTKLNLEIYKLKPKFSKRMKFGVRKPEQTLVMTKEKIHYQMDSDNVNDTTQNFDPFSNLNQTTPIVPLPDTFNSTNLNLELTDYTKKSRKIKKEIALEKDASASKYYRSDCQCSIM
ncbi:17560_t:CDS:2 [Gigaspora margarita]|uniref:17560_t:CDS:1 n=1 Tax=Gigaspora margarita TaxID=4874 RepID=A0ABN7ULW5_GIGMA|nr:17560_t:CDS:2 [Gigaspora margarita]